VPNASRAALPARHLSGWLLVVAALLILLASAVGIELLDARLAASLHAELTLAQVRAQTNRVSALAWEMAARHARPTEDVAEDRSASSPPRSVMSSSRGRRTSPSARPSGHNCSTKPSMMP
jgi:hypothetical protein